MSVPSVTFQKWQSQVPCAWLHTKPWELFTFSQIFFIWRVIFSKARSITNTVLLTLLQLLPLKQTVVAEVHRFVRLLSHSFLSEHSFYFLAKNSFRRLQNFCHLPSQLALALICMGCHPAQESNCKMSWVRFLSLTETVRLDSKQILEQA